MKDDELKTFNTTITNAKLLQKEKDIMYLISDRKH